MIVTLSTKSNKYYTQNVYSSIFIKFNNPITDHLIADYTEIICSFYFPQLWIFHSNDFWNCFNWNTEYICVYHPGDDIHIYWWYKLFLDPGSGWRVGNMQEQWSVEIRYWRGGDYVLPQLHIEFVMSVPVEWRRSGGGGGVRGVPAPLQRSGWFALRTQSWTGVSLVVEVSPGLCKISHWPEKAPTTRTLWPLRISDPFSHLLTKFKQPFSIVS